MEQDLRSLHFLYRAFFGRRCEIVSLNVDSFSGKRVSIIGAGISGAGLARLAHRLGARVFVSDEKILQDRSLVDFFQSHGIEWEEAGHTPRLFEADCILVGSGISPKALPVAECNRRNIPVIGELDFIAPFLRSKIIGVTGSNGKSTTTALLGFLLQKAGFSAEVAGNIGKSLADFAFEQRDFLVVELSSFQLHWNTSFACDLAMVTNLAPDHIDWHGSYEEYVKAKAKIISTQTPGAISIVQETERSMLLRGQEDIGREILSFSWDNTQSAHGKKLLADEKARHVVLIDETGVEELLFSFDDVPLIGKHNMENAAFAAGAVRMLTGKGVMRGPLFSGFKGLSHRCEFVASIRGVTYVDDSKGTNVAASATALRSLTGPKIVILGGQGKGEEYAPLAEAVKSEAIGAVVFGAEKDRIVEALKEAGFPHIHEVSSMEEAVQTASTLAVPQSTVLLSPACTSWDMYPNYKKRGEHFQQLVLALMEEG